jgi:hypothetical protein
MDSAETRRRVIGLLTLAYDARCRSQAGEPREKIAEEHSNAVRALMEGWGHYTFDLNLPPDLAAEVLRTIQETVIHQIGDDVGRIADAFTWVFLTLSESVEKEHPNADIGRFLRRMGLYAAEG